VIFTLTQQNGGEVISKMPGGVEMYRRLIARGAPAVSGGVTSQSKLLPSH
jgi:hypothetical protein